MNLWIWFIHVLYVLIKSKSTHQWHGAFIKLIRIITHNINPAHHLNLLTYRLFLSSNFWVFFRADGSRSSTCGAQHCRLSSPSGWISWIKRTQVLSVTWPIIYLLRYLRTWYFWSWLVDSSCYSRSDFSCSSWDWRIHPCHFVLDSCSVPFDVRGSVTTISDAEKFST